MQWFPKRKVLPGLLLIAAISRGADQPTAAVVSAERLGTYVAGGLGLYASADVWQKDLKLSKDLSFGVVRANTDMWDLLEPQKGQFNWAPLDTAVAEVRKSGLDLLFTIPISNRWNTPKQSTRWYGIEIGPTHFPTSDLASVKSFCQAIGSRYKGKIRYYEIWNEQDFEIFWKGKPDAAEYLKFIQTASDALRAADPGVVILIGGLAKPAETRWLDQFLALGGAKYFDRMSLHVYPAFASLSQALEINRKVLAKYGVSKPIWITETSTTGMYFEGKDRKDEEWRKALFLVRTYAEGLSQPDVQRVFWHTLRNPGKDVGLSREFDFGLMTCKGEPLPAYTAHQIFLKMLSGWMPQGRIRAEGSVTGFAFANAGRTLHVLWSTKKGGSWSAPKGSRVKLTTWDGVSREITAEEMARTLITDVPLYVEVLPGKP